MPPGTGCHRDCHSRPPPQARSTTRQGTEYRGAGFYVPRAHFGPYGTDCTGAPSATKRSSITSHHPRQGPPPGKVHYGRIMRVGSDKYGRARWNPSQSRQTDDSALPEVNEGAACDHHPRQGPLPGNVGDMRKGALAITRVMRPSSVHFSRGGEGALIFAPNLVRTLGNRHPRHAPLLGRHPWCRCR